MIQDLVIKAHQQRLTCLDRSTKDTGIKNHSMSQHSQDSSIAFLKIHLNLSHWKIKVRSKTKILNLAFPISYTRSMFSKQIALLMI